MALRQVLDTLDLLDGWVTGDEVADRLRGRGLEVETTDVSHGSGSTTFLRVLVPGADGRSEGSSAPTTGIIGRLGGVGARPGAVGMVSDADGAVAAVAAALKLALMRDRGDLLSGDVIITTHICPDAPTIPHDPVPFMGPPVPMATMNTHEVDPRMDAVLSIDATKGNRVLNHRGFAITPTVKEGYILPVAPDLLDLYEWVAGRPARVLPLSTYDITPYGNGLYHVNSILQPAVATTAPVVGIATTAVTVVPGTATGANHPTDIAGVVRYCIEVAKGLGSGMLSLFDADEFAHAVALYGSMTRLQGGDA
ncbi:MAG: DUF1177 domain-containing protein [Acidimicrobiia bacterium]|nr:DUF1177 domain-containing protein [Acidimicrobiia bacterium]MDH3398075.1 DUF1177 domain-containing protein [Acidimicrobiia bacterium]